MTFADQLQPHVKRLGTLRAAALCGVTPRSIQLWIRGEGNPNLATQAGALAILRKGRGLKGCSPNKSRHRGI